MGSIIIAMPGRADSVRLREILMRSGQYADIAIASHGAEILRFSKTREVSLIICTRRFSDMGYEELVSSLPETVRVLLLTKDAALTPFSSSVSKLLMPFRAEELIAATGNLLSESLRKKKRKPSRSPEEQKKINQAKQVLIEQRGMSEPEAYRYLQKTSMDTGRSFLETAEMILLFFIPNQ